MTRAIVLGGVHFAGKARAFKALDALHAVYDFAEIIFAVALDAGEHQLAEWARSRRVRATPVGMSRIELGAAEIFWSNRKLLDTSPDLVVVLGDARGAQNMADQAEGDNVRVVRIAP